MRRSVMPVLVAVAIATSPSGVLAQVAGRVLDEDGTPVVGATVEARNDAHLLSSTSTNVAGHFRFDQIESAVPVEYIVVRHIGYRSVVLTPAESPLVILERSPVGLPPIAATVHRDVECDSTDHRAPRIMREVSFRYRALPGGTLTASLLGAADRVSTDGLGATPTAGMAPGMVTIARRQREAWVDRARRGSYALETEGLDLIGKYDGWEYTPFELGLTTLFVEPAFLQNVDLYVEDGPAEELIIAFCSRAPAPVGVRGRFRLRNEHLVQVDWRFVGLGDGSTAGGKALLPPAVTDRSTYLLPIEAFFWRRERENVYYQEYYAFGEWRMDD